MFVLVEFRSSGVGAQLMQHAIAHARNLPGVLQIGLSVSGTQLAAIHLYASLGFRSWGSEPRALRHDGRAVTEQHMTLLLDADGGADAGRPR